MESPRNPNGEEERKETSLFGSGQTGTDDFEAQEAKEEVVTKVSYDVSVKSLLQGLENVGFDLEPEHRISFHHPEKNLYQYVGKVSDALDKDKFVLPPTAFKDCGNVS